MNDINSMTCQSEKISDIKWKDIKWEKAEKYVKRLQIRIVKAVKTKKWNLVKRLQHLLINSFFAKALSIKKVTTNKGKKTAGIDGVMWNKEEDKKMAIFELSTIKYKALPTKRIYIPKKNGKLRPLSIPTMKDRAMQTLQLLGLQPIEETLGDKNSYGFRKYRSCQDAMSRIFMSLSHKNDPEWILEGDIKGCFDNISHEWILKNIPMDKTILKEFLKAGFIYNKKLFPNSKGAAQGGAISPTIANITLDGLEDYIYNNINIGKRGKIIKSKNKYKIRFVRYADDFIVASKDKEILIKVTNLIKQFMKERGLELSDEKTVITNIKDGFDFLGWNFRKYNGKLIIKPSKKSMQGVKQKISDIIKKDISAKQANIIYELNPIIIGWSNYHQSVCSRKTFHKLDDFVFNQLYYNWALKRHRKKGQKWVINKYWKNMENRKWIFMEKDKYLRNFSDTPIVRHYWIDTNKNPYLDEIYFKTLKEKYKNNKFQRRKKDSCI